MESTESRFAHLLQPIRELTKNWDVDVAAELNDYLEELDEMCITFDGGKTRLNFAEAALLIQGSTCIYSKKVELLHGLVYQTLEYISEKNRRHNKQTAEAQQRVADGASTDRDDDLVRKALLLKGETLGSVKDFRINIFVPGAEDMIVLTLGSVASRLLLDKCPAESPRQQADVAVTENGSRVFHAFHPLDENVSGFLTVWMKVGRGSASEWSCLEDFRSWFTGTCENLLDQRRRLDPPEQKLRNGPRFTDLNYIYLDSVRDKLKTHRRICRKAGLPVPEAELRRSLLQPEEVGVELEDGFQHADLLENPKDELSYEDLVKLRVEQLVVSSRGYTQETALSQRVQDWKDAIQPELVRLEERPVFDIHDYSDRVVAALSSVGHRRSLASIVAGLDNFEACKYLLASLQLANDYTVAVDQLDGLDSSVDSMGLTLLSTLRATDRFQT
ncbi:unnamed protein product, partial [Tetraodon nigroviridis]